jgi:hypothetical protein
VMLSRSSRRLARSRCRGKARQSRQHEYKQLGPHAGAGSRHGAHRLELAERLLISEPEVRVSRLRKEGRDVFPAIKFAFAMDAEGSTEGAGHIRAAVAPPGQRERRHRRRSGAALAANTRGEGAWRGGGRKQLARAERSIPTSPPSAAVRRSSSGPGRRRT